LSVAILLHDINPLVPFDKLMNLAREGIRPHAQIICLQFMLVLELIA
jgi:hypothetical protein